MHTNHTSVIGPKTRPIRSVPWLLHGRRAPTRITSAIGTTTWVERRRGHGQALDRAQHARWRA